MAFLSLLALVLAAAPDVYPHNCTYRQGGAGSVTRACADKFADALAAKEFGAKCDGSTDDAPALALANTAAVAQGKSIFIGCKLRIASAAGTVAAGLRFEGSGALDLSPVGGSVTLTGPLTAPVSQVFFAGSGSLTFSAKVAQVLPQWWGAKGDGVTDDTASIQAAITAASKTPFLTTDNNLGDSGRTVYFPAGVYRVTSTLTVQHDGVSLRGEGPAASVIKPDADTSTDTIVYGPVSGSHSGRRSVISELGINNASTSTSRDAISITDTSYWRIKHVVIFQPGRYGVSIAGTLDGRADDVRVNSAGDSGVFIDKSASSGTGETTTLWTRLYTGNNQKHGALVRRGSHVTFIDSIFEFNGQGGVAGDGIKIGDQTADGQSNVKLISPYFEGNNGWDVYCGDVSAANLGGRVFVYGESATNTMVSKIGSALHARADYCILDLYGGYVSYTGQPAGLVQLNQYSADPRGAGGSFTSTVVGITGITNAALPAYLLDTVSTSLNKYNGRIEWVDGGGLLTVYGRYPLRIGGPAAVDSVQLTRDTAVPTSGTYAVADFAINSAANINGGNRALGFRNTAAGTPGTWETLWARTWRAGLTTLTYSATIATDASSGDKFIITATNGTAFTISNPTNLTSGQRLTYIIRNTSGGALGVITWGATFKLAAFTGPATANSRTIGFIYDGTNLIESYQTAADVPN